MSLLASIILPKSPHSDKSFVKKEDWKGGLYFPVHFDFLSRPTKFTKIRGQVRATFRFSRLLQSPWTASVQSLSEFLKEKSKKNQILINYFKELSCSSIRVILCLFLKICYILLCSIVLSNLFVDLVARIWH